ncbi:hypothetical protein AAF712_009443 [Marasmius tenuissimus]|uniref:S-adenosyl-L-methionine-dependent methyltransferase n=1 Tax=Marasmius tenuissimus TaxID=585030 RepID=A0ABR2ZPQ1_9AGAR
MSLSDLTSLQQTLNEAIDVYKAELAAQSIPEPSLNSSKPHLTDDIAYLPTPAMYEAQRTAVASLGLIKLLIRSPQDTLFATNCATLEVASIRLAAEIGLADVLGESEEGLSIREIENKTGVAGMKIERVLRLLITQGWFRETQPGYFANNRISNLVRKNQPGYYLSTYMNELVGKISASLPEMLTHPDPEWRMGDSSLQTAFQLSHNTDVSFFGAGGWLTKNHDAATSFALAMGAVGPTSDPGVVADFPWAEIAKGKDGIVDVGGGQGTLCCSLAEKYPEIQSFIVQDLPETRLAAEGFIESKGLSGKVKFEAQDFFKPQQRRGKYVFVMQRVLHDWSTEKGAIMLRHIKDVLNEDSSLLVIDTVIQDGVFSATSGSSLLESISAQDTSLYKPVSPPRLIPSDFGEASKMQHQTNVCLTALCNSFERTYPQLKEMVELSGMKIRKVNATRGWASITEVVAA